MPAAWRMRSLPKGFDAPSRVGVILVHNAPDARELEHLRDELDDPICGIRVRGTHASMQCCHVHPLKGRGFEWAPGRDEVFVDALLVIAPGAFAELGVTFQVGSAELGGALPEERPLTLKQGAEVVLTEGQVVTQRLVARLIEREFGDAAERDEALSALVAIREHKGLLAIRVDAHAEPAHGVVPRELAGGRYTRVAEGVNK